MGRKRKDQASASKSVKALEDFIGTTEAAAQLGVSQATLRRWITEGSIEAHKIGKQWRVRRGDLAKVVVLPTPETAADAKSPAPRVTLDVERKLEGLLVAHGADKDRARALVDEVDRAAPKAPESEPEVRRLLAALLVNAAECSVSDLHVDHTPDACRVRWRIDGLLAEMISLPRNFANALVDEIKRWAAMNVNERHRPQDGRVMFEYGDRDVELRVNVAPGVMGEVAAVRIMDRKALLIPLDHLGFEPDQLERWRRVIHSPKGLIIVTAPAGCGKTTTLYDSLCEMNAPSRKIMTAEDPVEVLLPGIDQMQIRPDIGVDFQQLTTAMLRQAVNIMFIGEIRSVEVAKLLCQAALTGHLVFSTMHTNDAPSVATHLTDMLHVEPMLVASALRAVLAQRLVRLVCAQCKEEYKPEARDLDALGLQGEERGRTFYRGRGCPACHMTGYRGRAGVFQLLEFTGAVRDAIAKGASTEAIRQAGQAGGMRTLREAALAKVFRGETSVEEATREVCARPGE